MSKTPELSLNDLQQLCATRLDNIFKQCLDKVPAPDLKSAIEYSLFNGGKRLRPLLVYATGVIFNAPWEHLDLPASAVEMMHSYSLIHDDLPSMDNADLRRGKPSCHKVYGEGMAILAGDALQTMALHALVHLPAPKLSSDRRLQMVDVLGFASGPHGMVGGQALDITLMKDDAMPDDLLEEIYHLKTGALFSACIELGRLASNDNDIINQKALREFGHYMGLAFQIQDDILDIESSTALLGKQQGIDVQNDKSTYPKLHGLPKAKEKVQRLYLAALESINYLGDKAQLLREIMAMMLKRER